MSLNVHQLKQPSKILIGADPEVFLKNPEGQYISAIGRFKGTKNQPVPVRSLGKGYAVQVDNVLLEYNVPAATNGTKWVASHTSMLEHLRKICLLYTSDAADE